MRILLDECIPRKLKKAFLSYECHSVPDAGWAGKKNGELLALAEESGYDVFITLDRGIEYQQNLQRRRIAVILLRTESNRLADLMSHVPSMLRALDSLQAGQLVKLGR